MYSFFWNFVIIQIVVIISRTIDNEKKNWKKEYSAPVTGSVLEVTTGMSFYDRL